MADPKQLEILKQGPEAWNEWGKHHRFSSNVSDVDLAGARLAGVHLKDAKLTKCTLLR